MEVTPEMVKKLRDKTGVGIGDCKKALVEAGGDFDKADKILKEKGLASAAKRAGRTNDEGRVFAHVKGTRSGIIQMACETDFVARNADFTAFSVAIAKEMIEAGQTEVNADQDQRLKDLGAKIKENITVKAVSYMDAGVDELVGDYVHMVNDVGRIGVLIKLKAADAAKAAGLKTLANDLALTVAAYNPLYMTRSDVPAAFITEQEEIFATQMSQDESLQSKPENVKQGILKGKVNKLLAEICLVDKPFIRDDKSTVAQALEKASKEMGTKIELVAYKQLRIGQDN
ncbi:MAG: translation elongation factor Ts [Spirochaetes bacterium GWB1_48_6]|nr:MAG: translation elongation factor Ts [Spirochaetes bacterium GWB1_48_6]